MPGEGWRPRGIIFHDITTYLESFGCLLTYLPIGGQPLRSNTVGLFLECHVEVCFGKNRLGNLETEIVDLPLLFIGMMGIWTQI